VRRLDTVEPPDDRKRRARAKLEALLLETIDEEGQELTGKDWAEMRREFNEDLPEARSS
jgi:hypothetical protein